MKDLKMKRYCIFTRALVVPAFAAFLFGCSPPPAGTPGPWNFVPDSLVLTADSVSFTMISVPGETFPTGTDDGGTAAVADNFRIGETEVTYELWHTVYLWATDAARGADAYTFQNSGHMGDGTGDTDQHPVTTVNWRDAIVWCNAATEWYDAETGAAYACVYKDGGTPIRDSSDANAAQCDAAAPDAAAAGFRLPSVDEWELAARWRGDSVNAVAGYSEPWFTHGDSASGATADVSDAAATGAMAVYDTGSTAVVKSKGADGANALGLYDMSGNVCEWCFETIVASQKAALGGSWAGFADDVRIGVRQGGNVSYGFSDFGFRLVMNGD